MLNFKTDHASPTSKEEVLYNTRYPNINFKNTWEGFSEEILYMLQAFPQMPHSQPIPPPERHKTLSPYDSMSAL